MDNSFVASSLKQVFVSISQPVCVSRYSINNKSSEDWRSQIYGQDEILPLTGTYSPSCVPSAGQNENKRREV